jgi:hypothetical protein
VWHAGREAIAKALGPWGGLGFDPHGLHNILTNQPIPWCHVVAHAWATWHHSIWPLNATCHKLIHPNRPINEFHITIYHLSIWTCHIIICMASTTLAVRTVWNVQSTIFFACLTIRTECDISLIRHPFEPKRVALGL